MLLDGRKKKGGVKMNRGRKDGNEMKNHEGYYDPTAGKAIRRALDKAYQTNIDKADKAYAEKAYAIA